MEESLREWFVLIVQWILFVGFSVIFCIGAFFNGSVAWRQFIMKEPDGPSFAPLLPGIVGVVAILAAPFGELSDRLSYLWIPLVVDFGSIPYFLIVVFYMIKEWRRP